MGLESAVESALLDRYIGYWTPYAISHDELDRENALQGEVRLAARALADKVLQIRTGTVPSSVEKPPRQIKV